MCYKNLIFGFLLLLTGIVLIVPCAAVSPQYFNGSEYAVTAFTNSLAEQPGYPLYHYITRTLVNVFSLNPYNTLAVFSVICHVIAGFIIYCSVIFLGNSRILGLSFAYAYLFYGDILRIVTDAEVFGMHYLLISLLFLSLVRFYYQDFDKFRLATLGLVFGLGSSHEHTILLWLPIILFLVFVKSKTRLFNATLIFVCPFIVGVSANLLLLTAETKLIYPDIDSIGGVLNYVFNWSALHSASEFSISAYNFINYLKELPVFVCGTIVLGVLTFKKRKLIFILLSLTLILHIGVIGKNVILDLNTGTYIKYIGTSAIFIIIATSLVLKKFNLQRFYNLFSLLILIPVIYSAKDNYLASMAHKDFVVGSELNAIAREVPNGAIFFASSKRVASGMLYQQIVNKRGTEIILIDTQLLDNMDYQEYLKNTYPKLYEVPELTYENIVNHFYHISPGIYLYSDGKAVDGYQIYPVGVTWRFIKSDTAINDKDKLGNLMNFCFNLPQSIFSFDRRRKHSDMIIDKIFLKAFRSYIADHPNQKATPYFSHLIDNIKLGNFEQGRSSCQDVLRVYKQIN